MLLGIPRFLWEQLPISNVADSSSTPTGALQVMGGAYIAKNIFLSASGSYGMRFGSTGSVYAVIVH